MTDFNFNAVALVSNCYDEKFGIPRQSGLSKNTESVIELLAPYNNEDYVRELEGFSHIWLVFVFHLHIDKPVKATVRPPRLGGNKRIGVFASRSPFRPNPIGLSVVKLETISKKNNLIYLHVSGADLVDGTPVIDIKPYITYADSIPTADSSYASQSPEPVLEVLFNDVTKLFIESIKSEYPNLESVISETLSLDPRPAYVEDTLKIYGISLFGLNIKWRVEANKAEVISIEKLT